MVQKVTNKNYKDAILISTNQMQFSCFVTKFEEPA